MTKSRVARAAALTSYVGGAVALGFFWSPLASAIMFAAMMFANMLEIAARSLERGGE